MRLDSLKNINGTVSLAGSFRLKFGNLSFFGFWACHSIVLHNDFRSSEIQNYLLSCEFVNPRLSELLLFLGIVGLTFKFSPSWFLDSLRLLLFPPLNSIMERKSSARKTEIERFFSHFRQLMTFDLTLVSGSESGNFLSVERDRNMEISQKVPNFGFLSKKDGFFAKICMLSVNAEIFSI